MTTKSPKQIILESGNNFHSQVVNLLRSENWKVMVSPYYSDNFTDKPREIDIIAEKKFEVHWMGTWLGTVDLRLFIECKYVNGNTVFWFDARDEGKTIARIQSDTGLKSSSDNISNLHYMTNASVAKLFASERSQSEDNELINRAINQSLNALVYYRGRNDLIFDTTENERLNQTKMLRRVPYPLIIVNSFDHFFRTDVADVTHKDEPITEQFQLEVNYAYLNSDKDGKNEYFLIDVIRIDRLKEFLSILESKDITEIRKKILFDKAYQGN